MRRQDAAKLYELSYFSEGEIFELGTNLGLSAHILGCAKQHAGASSLLHTVELSKERMRQAEKNLLAAGHKNIMCHASDGTSWVMRQVESHKSYSLGFIDHSHAYDHVFAACKLLSRVIRPGGFVAFHDFVDARNFDAENNDYGVFQGAIQGLADTFEFYGAFGCVGVFRNGSRS